MYLPEIRFCEPNDLQAVLKLNAESPWPWPESIINYDFSPASNNELSYIGAFAANQELLGLAVIGRERDLKQDFKIDAKTGVLMSLLVSRRFRRRGVASQLVMAAGDCAGYLGFKTLILRVRRTNIPAQNLYHKFNFEFPKNFVIRGYYSDGEDALVMSAGLPLNFKI